MIINSFSLAKLSYNNSDAAWLKIKAKLTVFICFVLISLIRTKTPENYSVRKSRVSVAISLFLS